MEKQSAATFVASLANAVRNANKGVPLARTVRQNLGVAAGTGAAFSPFAAGAAQAAGGSLGAHALAQGVNFGGSLVEAGTGTLLGLTAGNTPFVQRLLARYGPKPGTSNPVTLGVRNTASRFGLVRGLPK